MPGCSSLVLHTLYSGKHNAMRLLDFCLEAMLLSNPMTLFNWYLLELDEEAGVFFA